MTQLARIEPQTTEVATFGQIVSTFANLAGQIAETEFVPDALRKRPAAILACFMKGRELGLEPMQSLDSIDVIKGKPTLKPEAMRALVMSHGHRIWTDDYGDTRVTVRGQRAGEDKVESVTWTLDDAKRAGLANKDSWKSYPRSMLLARATAELCRLAFADVVKGLSYTPDEVLDFIDVEGSEERQPAQRANERKGSEGSVDTSPQDGVADDHDSRNGGGSGSNGGPLATAHSRQEEMQVRSALGDLDPEMREQAKVEWEEIVGGKVKIPDLTSAQCAELVALCAKVRGEVLLRRQKSVFARAAELGLKEVVDDDERRHLLVSQATDGAIDSVRELSAGQLTAVLDYLAEVAADGAPQPQDAA